MTIKKTLRIYLFSPLKRAISAREIRRYLKTSPEPKLNVGCGKNLLEGWLNTDLYPIFGVTYLNAAVRWPFPDASMSAVFCEHMIEHVPKEIGMHMIKEMYRVLKPGGYLRVVTPDIAWCVRLCSTPLDEDQRYYMHELKTAWRLECLSPCDAVNRLFYEHDHRYIYSADEMTSILNESGFSVVDTGRAGSTKNPVFVGTDGHGRIAGDRLNALEAFYVEARK